MRSVWSIIRGREATPDQLVATGAYGGGSSIDPVDGDRGWSQLGMNRTEVPQWTLRKTRASSLAAYRSNPMARAIIDTYTAFIVGDSGVGYSCTNRLVGDTVARFWNDPRNAFGQQQELLLRSYMLRGESALEKMQGELSGFVRYSPIDTERITNVHLLGGNPLWPEALTLSMNDGSTTERTVVGIDDRTGLRSGQVWFLRGWRALDTDVRGFPFLGPVLDDLDDFDQVLSNLVDRTALMRYVAMQVTLKGPNVDQTKIDEWIKNRGGTQLPTSGTLEVTNEAVEFKPLKTETGSFEDTNTLGAVLTNVAGGTGLAKTWLSDAEGANRATAMSMAEPVRRRLSGVQKAWRDHVTEIVRTVVDAAVAAGRLPALVEAHDASTGELRQIASADTVTITMPEIAAADATVTATMMLNLGQALEAMVQSKVLSQPAAAIVAEKAWEQFTGQSFRADLAVSKDPVSAMADAIDNPPRPKPRPVPNEVSA